MNRLITQTILSFLLAGPTFLITASAQSSSDLEQTMNTFIQDGMEMWQVPGLVVAVIKDDEVAYIKGFGVTDLNSNGPVDTKTMMMTGSTTKAITAAALGLLVDEGQLEWDDLVIDYMPEFRVDDAYVSSNLTVRDLLTHRAGMGNADILWLGQFEGDDVMHQMRYLKPSYGFRDGWIYQNVMWAVAGKLIEKVTGTPWSEFVQTRIFDPLAMTRSVPLSRQLKSMSNYVVPHHKVDGQVQVIDFIDAGRIAPAGDVWASIEDMSRWTIMMSDSGQIDNKQILSLETWNELLTPQTVIPKDNFTYPTKELTKPFWTTYAMGWFQHDYRGLPLSFHTGSLPGLIAIIGVIPEENFGVYVMGNLDHAELRHAILYKAIDLYVHQDDSRDWNTEVFNLYKSREERAKVSQSDWKAKRVAGTSPSHKPEEYAGIYHSELYGDISINNQDNGLFFDFSHFFKGTISHWHYETFEIHWEQKYRPSSFITFKHDAAGNPLSFEMFGEAFTKH